MKTEKEIEEMFHKARTSMLQARSEKNVALEIINQYQVRILRWVLDNDSTNSVPCLKNEN